MAEYMPVQGEVALSRVSIAEWKAPSVLDPKSCLQMQMITWVYSLSVEKDANDSLKEFSEVF